MAVTEAARHEMIVALGDAIGKEPAMALAAHLPPVGWADVATRADIDHLASLMDHRFAESRAELRAELQAEIGGLRSELHTEVASLRSELHTEVAGVRIAMADLEVRLTDKLTAQTRLLYGSVIATVLTIIGMGLLGG